MALTQIDDRGLKTPIDLLDNEKIRLGTGNDLEIYHDGSHSLLKHTTSGYLRLLAGGSGVSITNDDMSEAMAYFIKDGNVELYYNNTKTFETTTNGIIVSGTEAGNSFVYMYADEGDDAADKYRLASLTNGNWEVQNYSSGSAWETNIRATGGGAVSLYYNDAKKVETQTNGITVTGLVSATGNLLLNAADDQKLYLGASSDLQLYHDGTHSRICAYNTGNLLLKSQNDTKIEFGDEGGATELALHATRNGAVNLYYDNNIKAGTTSTGFHIHNGNLTMDDDHKVTMGTSHDLQLYHNGTNSYITNSTGWLQIQADNAEFVNAANSEYKARLINDGAVELYHNGSKRFETTSNGIEIYDHLDMDDSHTIRLGTSADFQIYHNGSHSYLAQSGTGSIILNVTSGQGTYIQTSSASYSNLSVNNSHSDADSVDFFQCRDSSNNLKLQILSGGAVQNANNIYQQISDVKLKENIVDANSQWEDIKAIKIRNWNFKASTGLATHKQIGVVAQEIETISPGLIDENIDRDPETQVDLGTKTKSVKYSILYMKAIKALQEAMAKIETLETKVAALESA